ncbi:unnamed protein product [Rhizophagus irregularis]|uniref:Uncharacterized protein n=1 Tax=Rhizophagus irregularis TaxID=588596 RepID=A0A2I1HIQ3_9GLOM|nr:hypothetical protein RhiirA4_480947 [Rhizophagus irregularis]CAB4407199.1 unnamed protein product [Rhizophagus irregularis]
MDYKCGWLIKRKVIEKVYDKIRGLEQLITDETDSDDTPKSYIITETDDRNEEYLRSIRLYWLTKGYEIDNLEIERMMSFRVDYEIIKDGIFMEEYIHEDQKSE